VAADDDYVAAQVRRRAGIAALRRLGKLVDAERRDERFKRRAAIAVLVAGAVLAALVLIYFVSLR
jgi:hypothetical protein